MAIKIMGTNGMPISPVMGNRPWAQKVEIIADTEADINNLGSTVTDGQNTVRPTAGSVAYTADLSVGYLLSPSGVWTKFRG